MAQVDISVNDRMFKVTCQDGQEARLTLLAEHLDHHVRELVRELGQIGDTRLLLLAALTVCDDLFDLRARMDDIESQDEPMDAATLGGATRVIDAATKRIERLEKLMANV